MAQDSVKEITLTQISTTVLDPLVYTAINPAGLPHACFLIRITNINDNLILVSFDGVTDHEVIMPDSVLELPSQTNSQPNAHFALFPKGTVVYARGIVPVAPGNVTLSGYYV